MRIQYGCRNGRLDKNIMKYHIKDPRAYRDMEEIYRYIAIEKQVRKMQKHKQTEFGYVCRFTSG